MSEVLARRASNDLEPLSGQLVFPANVNRTVITIRARPDNEEEPKEIFSLRLLSVTGGARLSTTDATAVLTSKQDLV